MRAVLPRFRPEMATFNAGSINFGIFPVARRDLPFAAWEREYLEGTRDYVFRNSFADMATSRACSTTTGRSPKSRSTTSATCSTSANSSPTACIETPFNMQFVLGVLGANAAEPDQSLHMLRTAERLFGADDFTWSAAGVGYPGEFNLAALSLMLGGNVRVGIEDNLRLRHGEAARIRTQIWFARWSSWPASSTGTGNAAGGAKHLRLKGASDLGF